LRGALRGKSPLKRHMILQHDSARSHTAASHIGENLSTKCSHSLPTVRTWFLQADTCSAQYYKNDEPVQPTVHEWLQILKQTSTVTKYLSLSSAGRNSCVVPGISWKNDRTSPTTQNSL
jgi:hypothetical protein